MANTPTTPGKSIDSFFFETIDSLQKAWAKNQNAQKMVKYFDIELNFQSVSIDEGSKFGQIFVSNDKKTETISVKLATRVTLD